MKHILYCSACKKFTMQDLCACGKKTMTVRPAKYSPDDKYADYRRKAKQIELGKQGLV